jgi:hypothetical protein
MEDLIEAPLKEGHNFTLVYCCHQDPGRMAPLEVVGQLMHLGSPQHLQDAGKVGVRERAIRQRLIHH